VIREAECIGCTKCIQACPVDAILGGPKLMHTVIAAECTGCDLCVEPCPVDCIDLVPLQQITRQWRAPETIARASLSTAAITSQQHAR
jgi:electron transport complex protein RnfB